MRPGHTAAVRWMWEGLVTLGGILLLWLWAAWLGFASKMSALPANVLSVRTLVGLVAVQLAGVGVYLLLAAFRPSLRRALLGSLPWFLFGLVAVNIALLAMSHFY